MAWQEPCGLFWDRGLVVEMDLSTFFFFFFLKSAFIIIELDLLIIFLDPFSLGFQSLGGSKQSSRESRDENGGD